MPDLTTAQSLTLINEALAAAGEPFDLWDQGVAGAEDGVALVQYGPDGVYVLTITDLQWYPADEFNDGEAATTVTPIAAGSPAAFAEKVVAMVRSDYDDD